jgi:peroxiredoxin
MRSKQLLIGVLTLAFAGGVAFLWLAPAAPRQAPELALTTLRGELLRMDDLRGRPVLVNFWSISCASCIEEIPRLSALYRELAAQGLEIIAISMPYDPPSHVLALSRGKQIPYPVALDIRGAASRAFGDVRLTPTTYLVAPDGHVVEKHTGELDIDRVRGLVLNMLQDNSHPRAPLAGS